MKLSTTEEKDVKNMEVFTSALCIINIDEVYSIDYVNNAFLMRFGYTQEELQNKFGNRLSALLDIFTLRKLNDFLHKNKENIESLIIEHVVKKTGGKEVWVSSEFNYISEKKDKIYMISLDINRYKKIEQDLMNLKTEVSYINKHTKYDIFKYDLKSGSAEILVANKCLHINSGVINNFVNYLCDNKFIHPDYVNKFLCAFQRIKDNKEQTVCELKMINLAGDIYWVVMSLGLVKIKDKIVVIGILDNTTKEKEAIFNYLMETQFYNSILSDQIAYGHLDVNEDKMIRVGGLWGLHNELINKISYSQFIEEFINKSVHQDDQQYYLEIVQCQNFIDSFENGIARLGCEFRRTVEINKIVWMELSVYLFKDSFSNHIMALLCIKNIDMLKLQQLTLLHENTNKSSLTNVYNKETAEISIIKYLKKLRENEVCAFMIANLNDFDIINTKYGHEEGNHALNNLVYIISSTFRKNDIIGRLSSDSFIIFVKDVKHQSIKERLKRITELLNNQYPPLSCKIGITFAEEGDTYSHIFKQASAALYVAKKDENNKYIFNFDKEYDFMDKRDLINKEHFLHFESILDKYSDTKNDAEKSFNSFIGKYGDIVYLINTRTFDLITGNRAFYDCIGMNANECVGKKCYELMHKRTSPCPFCSKTNWARDSFYLWRNFNVALQKSFLIKNKLVTWNGEEVLLAISVDLSNNKNILDFIDNKSTEDSNILSGIEHMQESTTLHEIMIKALEAICSYFRAKSVIFWKFDDEKKIYSCDFKYFSSHDDKIILNENQIDSVNMWLIGRVWKDMLAIERQDIMICYSYEMYSLMKEARIENQKWISLRENDKEIGVFMINNIEMNFHNLSFMHSFSGFIINEWKKIKMMETIIYSSKHDKLTGLWNRYSYEEFINHYSSDDVVSLGVIIIDMNGLKQINSLQGFYIGDNYLKQLSDILYDIFQEERVYRLNGDEFLVFMKDVMKENIELKVSKINKRIEKCKAFSASVGYAWDDIEKDLPELIEYAYQSMNVSKKHYYSTMKVNKEYEYITALNDLMNSIQEQEFEVFLQPKFNSATNYLVGAEALIRHNHKELGFIPPSKFIDKFERMNLIRYIDIFVFEEICKLLEIWKQKGNPCITISVNFSRQTLMEYDMISIIESIFSKYDILKEWIEVEITESFADMGKGLLYQAVLSLRKAGYRISLDDFGTKYTNLSILSEIEVDVLKIDKSLISSLVNQEKHQIILKNIIQMCKDLDIDVVAEGVEYKEQEDMLKKLGCYKIQGYLYSKPIPIKVFTEEFLHRAEKYKVQ